MENKEKLEQTEQKVFLNEQELKDVSGGGYHICGFSDQEYQNRWNRYSDLLDEVDCPSCGHHGLIIRGATPSTTKGICPGCGKYSYFSVCGETFTFIKYR